MNIMELKKAIAENNIAPLHIFYGPEFSVLETYIDNIKSKFGGEYTYIKSVSELANKLSGNSLFKDDINRLYVVREDSAFLTDEDIWPKIVMLLKKKHDTLIVKYGSIDQRSKFYKHFSDSITNFEKMSESVIVKHIISKSKMSEQNASKLCKICLADYGRILLELDKITNFANYYDISADQAFLECMRTNAIYIGVEGEIYDFISAILTKNGKEIIKQQISFNRRGDNPLLFISILHSTVKAVLQVKLLHGEKDISTLTGLSAYQVKNSYNYINNFTSKELIKMIRLCKYCDKGVKSGLIDSSYVIDYILINGL